MDQTLSGIVLAGGKSSRMGRDKAFITVRGKTLLQRQVDKLRAVGIEDIMISGRESENLGRYVPDVYPDLGPLGGLHACLKSATGEACVVISVDTPMIPTFALNLLIGAFQGSGYDAAVMENDDIIQPMIGVYSVSVLPAIDEMLQNGDSDIMGLLKKINTLYVPFMGDERLLEGCDTPEELEELERIIDL